VECSFAAGFTDSTGQAQVVNETAQAADQTPECQSHFFFSLCFLLPINH
jgi:F0F1-type ATP synthase membrane subunit c/vacuolar-type H+-ATPase subunit K